MALPRRQPTAELVHHSDRGSQYTAAAYQTLRTQHGVSVSMSRAGDCDDNALAESVFATLKTELIEMLGECDPEANVYLGIQPSWPFEESIAGLIERRQLTDHAIEDEDYGEFRIEGMGRQKAGSDVFILEDRQLDYGGKDMWKGGARW